MALLRRVDPLRDFASLNSGRSEGFTFGEAVFYRAMKGGIFWSAPLESTHARVVFASARMIPEAFFSE